MKELLGFYAPIISPICFIIAGYYYGETMELKALKKCGRDIDAGRFESIKIRAVFFFIIAIVTLF